MIVLSSTPLCLNSNLNGAVLLPGGYVGYALTTAWNDGQGLAAAAATAADRDEGGHSTPARHGQQVVAKPLQVIQRSRAALPGGWLLRPQSLCCLQYHFALCILCFVLPGQSLCCCPDCASTEYMHSTGTGHCRIMQIIGFDMGGTSTDVSRYAGSYEHVFESTTAGVTIQAPQLDINTVAAGGGSRLFYR